MKLHWIGASKSAPNAARAKIVPPPPAAVDDAPRFIFHEGERLQDLAHLGKSVAQVNVSVSSLQGSEGEGKPMLGFGLDHAANRDNIASTLIQASLSLAESSGCSVLVERTIRR